MSWPDAAATVFVVLVASFAGTRLALWALGRRAILDHPNERSSHVTPKPRGAGLAVTAVVVVAWGALGTGAPSFERAAILSVCAGALGLAALSFVDDLKGLSVGWRLLGQFAAVAAVLAATAERGAYFAGILSPAADLFAAALLWVWFINLFNFMDGIDGIAGVETASVGFGVTCAALLAGIGQTPALLGLTIAAAALGFLWWNWEPAKVFLGDVGSVPLGFLLGWLLLAQPRARVASASRTLLSARGPARAYARGRRERDPGRQRPVDRPCGPRHDRVDHSGALGRSRRRRCSDFSPCLRPTARQRRAGPAAGRGLRAPLHAKQ